MADASELCGFGSKRVVTGVETSVRIGRDGRRLLAAAVANEGTAAVKLAAGRPVEQARHLALEREPLGPGIRIGLRIGREEGKAIGMARAGEDHLGRSQLNEA